LKNKWYNLDFAKTAACIQTAVRKLKLLSY